MVIDIACQFGNYLKGKNCKVLGSNLAVRITEDTFRIPDLSIICDFSRFKYNNFIYEGVPKLIAEVKSPGNKKSEMEDKRKEYYSIGVKEYWVIYNEYSVEINIWSESGYITIPIISNNDELCIPVHLSGWELIVKINLNEIPEELRTDIIYKI